jgi:hypothetical protein
MTKNQALNLRAFRTLTGPARKVALRDHLKADGLQFGLDPHTISNAHRLALADLAKVCGYRKPVSSGLSLATCFYVYLSRGA